MPFLVASDGLERMSTGIVRFNAISVLVVCSPEEKHCDDLIPHPMNPAAYLNIGLEN
jgi:hypothetical protein